MSSPSRTTSGFRKISGIFMAAVYAAAGATLIFFWSPDFIPAGNRFPLGCFLLVYSFYRLYRATKSRSHVNQDQEE